MLLTAESINFLTVAAKDAKNVPCVFNDRESPRCRCLSTMRKCMKGGIVTALWQPVNQEVIRFDGLSASTLADQLDGNGVVRLRDAFSDEFVADLRDSVNAYIDGYGEGDLLIPQPDHAIGSPAHRLVSDPALQQLFGEVVSLRWPRAGMAQGMKCVIPVRAGNGPQARSNLFHYDASVLTMIVPIFVPDAAVGSCGELATFANKRPFRRFVASHLVDMARTYSSAYRRRVAKKILDAPNDYVVDLRPGDAYLFWGYRTYHGNLPCASGLLRAVLVVQFGEVHPNSRTLKWVWRLGRNRHDLRRYQFQPRESTEATGVMPA